MFINVHCKSTLDIVSSRSFVPSLCVYIELSSFQNICMVYIVWCMFSFGGVIRAIMNYDNFSYGYGWRWLKANVTNKKKADHSFISPERKREGNSENVRGRTNRPTKMKQIRTDHKEIIILKLSPFIDMNKLGPTGTGYECESEEREWPKRRLQWKCWLNHTVVIHIHIRSTKREQ